MRTLYYQRIRQLALLGCLVATCARSIAQMIEPDVQVYLERISPVDGRTIWSVRFVRELTPDRCEAYTNGIVTIVYSKGGCAAPSSQVCFLNDKTGEAVK